MGHPVRRVVRLLSSPNRIMRSFDSWLRTRRVTGITWLCTSTCCTTYRTRHQSGRRCKDNLIILSMKYQCERSIQSGHRCHGIRQASHDTYTAAAGIRQASHDTYTAAAVMLSKLLSCCCPHITPSFLLSTRPQHSQCARCTGSVLREIPGTSCVIPGHRLQNY